MWRGISGICREAMTFIGSRTPLQLKIMDIVVWPVGDRAHVSTGFNDELPPNCRTHFVCGETQLDALIQGEGIAVLLSDRLEGSFDRKLGQGQVAVIIVGEDCLAHVTWIGLREKARDLLFDPPLSLQWRSSAILSGSYTWPSYRGCGLYSHGLRAALAYLDSCGVKAAYGSSHWRNVASRRGLSKAGALVAARCLRARFLIPGRRATYVAMLTWGFDETGTIRWTRKYSDRAGFVPRAGRMPRI